MSFNGGTLKVFVNGAWIIWIYLFTIFIRLDYVDAKIGKQIFPHFNIKTNQLISTKYLFITLIKMMGYDTNVYIACDCFCLFPWHSNGFMLIQI